MEEWPDDHLDNLFRKSAEEYDVPFNADDWTDMSRRLDGLDWQTLFDRISRWGGISALLFLLLGGLGWLAYDKQPAGTNRQIAGSVRTTARKPVLSLVANSRSGLPNQSQPVEPKELRTVSDKRSAKVDDKLQRQQLVNSTYDPAGQLTTNAKAYNPLDKAGRKARRSSDKSMTASIPYVRLTNREKQLVNTNMEAIEDKTASLATRPSVTRRRKKSGRADLDEPAQAGNSISQLAANIVMVSGGQPVDAELGTDTKWLPSLTTALSVTNVVQQVRLFGQPTLSEETVQSPLQRPVPRLSRLSVMVFASPDLSAIGLRNFNRPGSNAGLAVQYQITDRLSVSTGAMYSIKRYQTYSSEYVWPTYMKMDVLPEEISGVCKMIDIPLNMRYDWLMRPRGNSQSPARWFASAGLTSYFIQHEVYNYEYANPNDSKIKYWGWDNKKAGRPGGSFGFSNINVSIGYERPITHRLSWQIEPFMKVPLKQVGYFKVRLLSTGAFVGLRYRL